ncbi:TetR/AcrR family transcriptional regulator [Labrys neptuniae]
MTKAKARREELKDSLIEAAERTIVAHGHTALKARALAEEVGCALGAIYTVFPDLAALILAVNARSFALLDTMLTREAEAAAAAGGGPRAIANRTLIALANGYLDFAADHSGRWRALFDFRLPEGQDLPQTHQRQLEDLFRHLETPVSILQPSLAAAERGLLARSLFAAAHGMVLLGLEGKLVQLPLPYLREQIALVVSAMGRGLEGD